MTALLRGAVLCALVVGATATAPTVTLSSGVLVGKTTSLPSATAAVNNFLGVPFAQSPPERFAPPAAATKWSSPYHAVNRTAACVQQFDYPASSRNFTMEIFNNPFGPPPAESEDCMYLNVFTPSSKAPDGGFPVMFWIFGGGYQFGTAMLNEYDGSSFAYHQDVIVVAAKYRTGAFGFPGAPQIAKGENNIALLDQRFALQWVQDNIAAFGGDKDKVTIFGQSAGGKSVDLLILGCPDNAPFYAAIMESGQGTVGRQSQNDGSDKAWDALVSALSCGSDPSSSSAFTCVKNAKATDIKHIAETQKLSFDIIPDNVTVPSDPYKKRTSGSFAKVPVLFGTNAQEGRVFEVGQNNLTKYINSTFHAYPDVVRAVTAAYPIPPGQSDYDVISQIYTDYGFLCPFQGYENLTVAESIPAWRYYYNATFKNTNPAYPMPLGVTHSFEIPLVFGTYNASTATAQEVTLSKYMQTAWANFAKDPTAGPGWTAVGKPYSSVGALGTNGSSGVTVFDPRSNVDVRCGVFNEIINADDSM